MREKLEYPEIPKCKNVQVQLIRSHGNNVNKELAYIIGVYLGDGSIDKSVRTFCLQTIDRDFAGHAEEALKQLTKNSVSVIERNRKTMADNTVWAVSAYDAEFCRKLQVLTGQRKHLPVDFEQWEELHQKWLIAGLLDSEGYVSMYRQHLTENGTEVFSMSIGIGATDIWLNELHQFLKTKEYGVGIITRELLKSGLIFSKFSFNKKAFIASGLFFTIKRKQDRIEHYKTLFPGSTTIRGLPKLQYMKDRIS